MKSAVLFVVLFCVYVAMAMHYPVTNEIIKSYKHCYKSLHLNIKTHMRVIAYKDTSDEKINCARACVLKHAGLLNKGKVNVERLKELWASADNTNLEQFEVYLHLTEYCRERSEVSEDDCVVAGNLGKCYAYTQAPHINWKFHVRNATVENTTHKIDVDHTQDNHTTVNETTTPP